MPSLNTAIRDWGAVSAAAGLMKRLAKLAEILADMDKRPGDFFVMDAAIPYPVDPSRRTYGVLDFTAASGDGAIICATRRILKRDPLYAEFLALRHVFVNSGKMDLLRHILSHPQAQATISDLENYTVSELTEISRQQIVLG